MKKILLLIAALLSLSITTGCNNTDNTIMEAPELIPPADAPVYTVTAKYDDLLISKYYTAIVTPYVEEYAFTIDGTISKIHVNIGSTVQKGDLLAELDHSEIDAKIAATENDIATIKSATEKEAHEYTTTLEDLRTKRDELLSGTAKSSNPDAEIELLDCDIAIYEAKLKQNEDNYKTALSGYTNQLARLKEEYPDYFIYAPMAGDIVFTSSESEVPSRTPVVAIADLTQKYIQTDPADYYASNALNIYTTKDGSTYPLTYVPINHEHFNENLIDAKGLLTNFVADSDFMDSLAYGQKILVTIDTELIEDVLLVPNTTIHYNLNYEPSYVYVVDEDGGRTRRYITAGKTNSIYMVITDGLEEGDEIYVPY